MARTDTRSIHSLNSNADPLNEQRVFSRASPPQRSCALCCCAKKSTSTSEFDFNLGLKIKIDT
jgi:hypothetical protein